MSTGFFVTVLKYVRVHVLMNFAKYRVQLSTEKKYSSKYEYKYEYEYSIPGMWQSK